MKYVLLIIFVFVFSSCSTDEVDPTVCGTDESYNQITETCVPKFRETMNNRDVGLDDTASMDDAEQLEDTSDNSDLSIDTGECDKDDDGEKSLACGGLDCDDNDILRSSSTMERCDEIDNNCSGENNEGLDCTFFAHSETDLYKVDPFQLTAVKISGGLPSIFDIDTHPDGRLFGISSGALFLFNPNGNLWEMVGAFGQTVAGANGMAIDNNGTAFITAGERIYTVNLTNGRVSRLGNFGGSFQSSGDCVVNKSNTLYMSSRGEPDRLVSIDRTNGRATDIGPIGFNAVYALVAGWEHLYGLTSFGDDGQLIKIDPATGQGTLIHTFPGIQFFGSASDPGR